jgi:hypothetical protein
MVGLIILAGCIAIPVNYHAAGSRQNVNQKVQVELQPGITTKEDVFLRLGEPDYYSEDGQVIGYAWTKVGAILMVGGYGSAAAAEIGKSYLFEISFDSSNYIARVELRRDLWSGELR